MTVSFICVITCIHSCNYVCISIVLTFSLVSIVCDFVDFDVFYVSAFKKANTIGFLNSICYLNSCG